MRNQILFLFDADPDPGPDPDFLFDADPDPGSQNNADPGPQHCELLPYNKNVAQVICKILETRKH